MCVASEITDVVCGQFGCNFNQFDARFVKFGKIGTYKLWKIARGV